MTITENTNKKKDVSNLLMWIRNINRENVLKDLSIVELKNLFVKIENIKYSHSIPESVCDCSKDQKQDESFMLLVRLLTQYCMVLNYYIVKKEAEFLEESNKIDINRMRVLGKYAAIQDVKTNKCIAAIESWIGFNNHGKCRFTKIIPSQRFLEERKKIGLREPYKPFIHIQTVKR